jgi:ribosomal-protein-alanine N-acetyltransferase
MVRMQSGVVMRLAGEGDSPAFLRAYLRNREHLRPWEPDRREDFFTPAGQAARLDDVLRQHESGRSVPWVLVEGRDIIGSVTLSNLSLGPFRSANIGYWVDASYGGRGLATEAVRAVCADADERLDLHRVEAGTLIDNIPSRKVLEKAGFTDIGTAQDYLHINGEWRDHLLFHRILNHRPPGSASAA